MSDSSPAVIEVTDATFVSDVIEASKERPVVVDFWAAWCGPCRALGPVLEAAVADHGGVTLAKLDTDANPRTAAAFGIQGIPAVKAFKDGRIVSEFLGAQPKPAVERFLAALAPPAALTQAPPEDEDALRAVLAEHPDHIGARRTLARLLYEGDRFDEAREVIAEAPSDPVCDGLSARMEMRAEGDATLAALLGDDHEIFAVPALIAAIRNSRDAERARLRRVAVGIIDAAAEADPDAAAALRSELASALF